MSAMHEGLPIQPYDQIPTRGLKHQLRTSIERSVGIDPLVSPEGVFESQPTVLPSSKVREWFQKAGIEVPRVMKGTDLAIQTSVIKGLNSKTVIERAVERLVHGDIRHRLVLSVPHSGSDTVNSYELEVNKTSAELTPTIQFIDNSDPFLRPGALRGRKKGATKDQLVFLKGLAELVGTLRH